MKDLEIVHSSAELLPALETDGCALAFLGLHETADCLRAFVDKLGAPLSHKHSEAETHIVEIRADGSSYDKTRRPQNTPERQSAHTDGSFLEAPPELVVMCALGKAAYGGESIVVSGADLLLQALEVMDVEQFAVLFDPDCYIVYRGSKSLARPVLAPSTNRQRIKISFGAHEFNHVDVKEACRLPFELLRGLRSRPDLERRFILEPGMALFLANSFVLHGRERWLDAPGSVRHLIRLWRSSSPDSSLAPLDGVPVVEVSGRLSQLLLHGTERLARWGAQS